MKKSSFLPQHQPRGTHIRGQPRQQQERQEPREDPASHKARGDQVRQGWLGRGMTDTPIVGGDPGGAA